MLSAIKVLLGIVLGVPATTAAVLLYCQVRNFFLFRIRGCNLPAVRERPLLGSFEFEEPHILDAKYIKEYGTFFYWTILTFPAITVVEPDLVQLIYSKENFPKSAFYQNVSQFVGDSLLTLAHGKEGSWKERRDLVNPAFKVANLRAMRQIFANHAVHFTEKLLQVQPDTSIDFAQEVAKITLDTISSAGFNHELRAIDTLGKENKVLNSLQEVVSNLFSPLMMLPFGASHIVPFLQKRNLNEVNKLLYSVIDKRIKEHETGKKDPSRISDLLDMMMEPGDGGRQLSREELRNELLIFYLAGYETTSTTLSWAVYELAKNPEVYQKLVDEVDSVMGRSADVVCPSNEELDQMTYLTMVLNETLRKYPPVSGNSRTISETFEYKGYIFPKGYMVVVSVLGLHRSEKYWPDPLKYDPQRFSKENTDGRNLYTFIPFSAGPRICVGKNFFYLEAKAILATMIHKVKFELDPTKESGREICPSGLLRPNAVWLKVSNRSK